MNSNLEPRLYRARIAPVRCGKNTTRPASKSTRQNSTGPLRLLRSFNNLHRQNWRAWPVTFPEVLWSMGDELKIILTWPYRFYDCLKTMGVLTYYHGHRSVGRVLASCPKGCRLKSRRGSKGGNQGTGSPPEQILLGPDPKVPPLPNVKLLASKDFSLEAVIS